MAGVPAHEAALEHALSSGVAVIDTSDAYGGGASERLVRHVLQRDPKRREQTSVITKFGYVQADGVNERSVDVAPGVRHSIGPEFMRQQLTKSLDRLLTRPDVYMVHNPEHHLEALLPCIKSSVRARESVAAAAGAASPLSPSSPQPPDPSQLAEARRAFYVQMQELFAALEAEVASGRIRSYGVSCKGLSLPKDDPLHVAWEDLLGAAAAAAAATAGSSNGGNGAARHSLTMLEMPANIYEPLALSSLPAMRAAGLHVLLNRPLTAVIAAAGVLRLVEPPGAPADYMDVCRAALRHFSPPPPEGGRAPTPEELETLQGCRFLQQLVQDLNSQQMVKFTSFSHYESELATSIIPMVRDKFESMDEESADFLQAFFERYGAMVRYSCGQQVREALSPGGAAAGAAAKRGGAVTTGPHNLDGDQTVQDYALEWLLRRSGDACVVIGMPGRRYVDEALAVARRL
ncbi:unnamed protein product [Phaeothamnion confervicola]